MSDKTARECREFADRFDENTALGAVATRQALTLLTKAANRIDALCSAHGRLLDKNLPKPPKQRRPKREKPIDWAEVRAAQKRGKYGHASKDDHELCQRAFETDQERYGRQEKEMFREVFTEVTLGAPFPERDEEKA